jgi:hypothetical protein
MQLGTSLSLWLIVRLLTHNEYDFALSVTALESAMRLCRLFQGQDLVNDRVKSPGGYQSV